MFIIPLVPTINKWNKIDISMSPKTNCTAITVFNGKLDSTLGLPRLTKFIKDLTSYYEYLDTLNLLEVSSIFHMLIILTVFLFIIDIYCILFANEIISYFRLEKKYPKLEIFFKLRLKFQRYHLLINLF